MLIIRREQMDTFNRAALMRFEQQLLADLRRNYQADFVRMGEAGVRELIRGAVKRGASYGITAERDVSTLAELDLSLGAPFERQKGCTWAAALLADQNVTAAGRLTAILARLPEA